MMRAFIAYMFSSERDDLIVERILLRVPKTTFLWILQSYIFFFKERELFSTKEMKFFTDNSPKKF